MTFNPKAARTLVERLHGFAKGCRGSMWQSRDETILLMDEAADTLTAALDEIERLRSALDLIATHRAKCHAHDDDMGHQRRGFDAEDVKLMEYAASAALKGPDQ